MAMLCFTQMVKRLNVRINTEKRLYFIDGQTIRLKNQYGEAIYFQDGQTLRSKNQYGDPLYFVDGNTVKYKNQYGDPMYFLLVLWRNGWWDVQFGEVNQFYWVNGQKVG